VDQVIVNAHRFDHAPVFVDQRTGLNALGSVLAAHHAQRMLFLDEFAGRRVALLGVSEHHALAKSDGFTFALNAGKVNRKG
jgi:hypothetical protein